MKILALVASQDSTVEDVKTNGRRQMQALIGKDKEVLFCEYSTIEICRNGELAITCLGEKMEKPDYFWPLLGSTDGFILENMLQDAGIPSILNLRELQVARSKIATYQRFAQNGIRVPDTMVFFKDSDPETLSGRFGYPFVVKPDSGFGGVGVELIHTLQLFPMDRLMWHRNILLLPKEETSVVLFSMADIIFRWSAMHRILMNSVRMYMWVELHRRRLLPKKKRYSVKRWRPYLIFRLSDWIL